MTSPRANLVGLLGPPRAVNRPPPIDSTAGLGSGQSSGVSSGASSPGSATFTVRGHDVHSTVHSTHGTQHTQYTACTVQLYCTQHAQYTARTVFAMSNGNSSADANCPGLPASRLRSVLCLFFSLFFFFFFSHLVDPHRCRRRRRSFGGFWGYFILFPFFCSWWAPTMCSCRRRRSPTHPTTTVSSWTSKSRRSAIALGVTVPVPYN